MSRENQIRSARSSAIGLPSTMAAFQRKTCEEERKSDVEIAAKMEDRLSDLPEALQLRILACLDARQAVQSSVLSKTWNSVWTRMPVLELNHISPNGLSVFDKFVNKVLCSHDPLAPLETLKYKFDESCRPEMLKSVFDYAFLRRVNHLEVSIKSLWCDDSWPVSVCESLTSLKLQNKYEIRCPFQGPTGSILFKNLTVLHLEGALITDVEPFSGFPVLESLTLVNCHVDVELSDNSRTLKVHSLGLSDLNISNCTGLKCIDLKTPSLKSLEYRGCNPVKHSGLTVLETLKIDFDGFSYCMDKKGEKKLIDDLMSLFCSLPDVKSLTVFSGTVLLLAMFQNELGSSPFRELKDLTMHLSEDYQPILFHRLDPGWSKSVKDYFLHNSPHAKFSSYPPNIERSSPPRFSLYYEHNFYRENDLIR